ncbi:hypothetical protein GCM10012287_02820 [Streptomyces daqingensis]|uniref:Uncharacterized protein n=1 Tax=Streptomyces daqingensis TaxID=1472640 RepID=A0ABQ2LRN3_9ACTN|nr:hypothetical protein [Streptomyces daqingensis]GGO42292.1 hypothetical protein GCM10012287_02820 [Streptomyces daqingensis]
MGQHVTGLRRLAFPDGQGKTIYIQNGGAGIMAAVADGIEEGALNDAKAVLEMARHAMGPDGGDPQVLRFVAARLADALHDALRVAQARGERLPQPEE